MSSIIMHSSFANLTRAEFNLSVPNGLKFSVSNIQHCLIKTPKMRYSLRFGYIQIETSVRVQARISMP